MPDVSGAGPLSRGVRLSPFAMNALSAKFWVQVLGSLATLTSLHFFERAYLLLSIRDWPGLVLVVPLGLYFCYVGYVTWLKFSARAIRHICGASLFFIFFIGRVPIKMTSQLSFFRREELSSIQGLLSVGLIAGLVWLYRHVWRYFTRLIFGEQETET